MLSDSQRILVVAIMLTFVLWGVESFFLVKLSGKEKRGVKIWSKSLSNTTLDLLKKLDYPSNHVIEPFKSRNSTFYSFIIVRDDEAIISPAPHSFVPCVAYVNFAKAHPNLEYRGGISHFFVFAIAFASAAYFVIPVFALILAINYWAEISSIDNYLKRKLRVRRTAK
jgi:hypothetical protein